MISRQVSVDSFIALPYRLRVRKKMGMEEIDIMSHINSGGSDVPASSICNSVIFWGA